MLAKHHITQAVQGNLNALEVVISQLSASSKSIDASFHAIQTEFSKSAPEVKLERPEVSPFSLVKLISRLYPRLRRLENKIGGQPSYKFILLGKFSYNLASLEKQESGYLSGLFSQTKRYFRTYLLYRAAVMKLVELALEGNEQASSYVTRDLSEAGLLDKDLQAHILHVAKTEAKRTPKNSHAIGFTALCYFQNKDYKTCLSWLDTLNHLSNPPPIYYRLLGLLHHRGEAGKEHSHKKAFEYYEKGTQAPINGQIGERKCYDLLAYCYRRACGIPNADHTKAKQAHRNALDYFPCFFGYYDFALSLMGFADFSKKKVPEYLKKQDTAKARMYWQRYGEELQEAWQCIEAADKYTVDQFKQTSKNPANISYNGERNNIKKQLAESLDNINHVFQTLLKNIRNRTITDDDCHSPFELEQLQLVHDYLKFLQQENQARATANKTDLVDSKKLAELLNFDAIRLAAIAKHRPALLARLVEETCNDAKTKSLIPTRTVIEDEEASPIETKRRQLVRNVAHVGWYTSARYQQYNTKLQHLARFALHIDKLPEQQALLLRSTGAKLLHQRLTVTDFDANTETEALADCQVEMQAVLDGHFEVLQHLQVQLDGMTAAVDGESKCQNLEATQTLYHEHLDSAFILYQEAQRLGITLKHHFQDHRETLAIYDMLAREQSDEVGPFINEQKIKDFKEPTDPAVSAIDMELPRTVSVRPTNITTLYASGDTQQRNSYLTKLGITTPEAPSQNVQPVTPSSVNIGKQDPLPPAKSAYHRPPLASLSVNCVHHKRC
ncbi:MAG: hypothetical protein CMF50_04695 [Legionellales bacterium]|nr:hypothetical protein [Legionellales bacterium]|tara:strand:+ start:20567 stop:22915 length:2349 start_codon:yes stop_codon:yes gene_type:complete